MDDETHHQLPFLSLAQYVDSIVEVPLPTAQQRENFVEYVSHADSWYKWPINGPGQPFYFFVDKYAGMTRWYLKGGKQEFTERAEGGPHYSDIPTEEYRTRFGHLAYHWDSPPVYPRGIGPVFFTRDSAKMYVLLPEEILEAGLTRLTGVIHTHSASFSWEHVIDWPEESGGQAVLEQILARSRAMREPTFQREDMGKDMAALKKAYPYIWTHFLSADPVLNDLLAPERRRQYEEMGKAIDRVCKVIDRERKRATRQGHFQGDGWPCVGPPTVPAGPPPGAGAGGPQARLDTGRTAYFSGDYAVALQQLQPLSNDGNPTARRYLAYMYLAGHGVAKNPGKGVELLRISAEQGDLLSAFGLGGIYSEGLGVDQSYKVAVEWYGRAAEGGQPNAQANLGGMYQFGHGVPQNSAEAVRLYRLAAQQGHIRAMTILGYLYEEGVGVQRDEAEAARWLKCAAQEDYSEAEYLLGLRYIHGSGGPADLAEAAKWFRRAAEQGEPRAQFNLGVSFATGQGTPRDPVQACLWFGLAASKGNVDAQQASSQIEQSMSEEELSEARTLAQQWRPRERMLNPGTPDWKLLSGAPAAAYPRL